MKVRAAFLSSLTLLLLTCACNQSSTPAVSNSSNTSGNSSGPAATPDPFAAARGVFAKNCQTCHGPIGAGGPVKLEDGTKLKVPNLREGHAVRHPDSDFLKQINKGGDGMPAFKDKLTPQQIDELIRFIRQEFQAGAQAQTPSSR